MFAITDRIRAAFNPISTISKGFTKSLSNAVSQISQMPYWLLARFV
jgi:hypothetical protein